jgi:glucose/mannose transport system permease protein
MSHTRREQWIPILMILPSVILIAIFVYGFIAWTGWVSLSQWNGVLPNYSFAGLKNYLQIFSLSGGVSAIRFRIDLWNTLFFTLLFLGIAVTIGLFLAILLDQKVHLEGLFRTIYLFPMSLSFVVTGVVWQWIFAPGTAGRPRGINALLQLIGLQDLQWRWYTSTESLGPFHLALIPVVIAAAWQMTGYTMAMYLAGLRSVPEELREAARVDGATETQVYRYVVLPLLQPITLSALIILGHISLKIFDLIYTMTGKGPAFVTDVPGIFMFETTFQGNHYAQGAAISIVMLVMVATVIIPYLFFSLRSEVEI